MLHAIPKVIITERHTPWSSVNESEIGVSVTYDWFIYIYLYVERLCHHACL